MKWWLWAKGNINFGDPGGSRTPNPQIRSLMLYPVELRGRDAVWKLSRVARLDRPLGFAWAGLGGCPTEFLGTWGGRRESNPQQPEPQSGALPVELLPPQPVDYSNLRLDLLRGRMSTILLPSDSAQTTACGKFERKERLERVRK